ncbi:MAG TPA: hypothetical protein VGL72_29260 [Bryobacteraceae bacterium]|jgi:hypothetical protein
MSANKIPFLILLASSPLWCETPHPPLGAVTESADSCAAGPLAKTLCRRLVVACPGVKDIQVSVRIIEPAEGVPFRGTVVMGSGGSGAGFYGGDEGGQRLEKAVTGMGFRVIDRSWAGGWPTAEGGMVKESCRYATLLTWVHEHLHKGGKFVATGNSGGSAEIGYALTTWGRGDILDVAVPTSGPPLGRLDYACVKEASPEWSAMCASIVPKGVMECSSGCILGPGNAVCKQVTAEPTAEQLLNDSVMHPGAVVNYPRTKLYFLYGAHDCGEPVPIGLTYATKVTSEKSIQFVPHTPHALFSTPDGREAIRKAIDEGTK